MALVVSMNEKQAQIAVEKCYNKKKKNRQCALTNCDVCIYNADTVNVILSVPCEHIVVISV